ncbi:MAG TPA: YicC family protein [Halieaceae bacterium]|nr:MAG: YicC family protein [Gammaproteobacteria bacterium]HDY83673.1 YicC family protein [Halieaceae bacterium]
MTSFARESATTDQGILTVELRSVNHRYLDCSFKLPDALRSLEPQLREQAGKALARGKLDCMIRLQAHPTNSGELQVNTEQLHKLLAATLIIKKQMGDASLVSPLEVLQFPGIYNAPEQSDDVLQKNARSLFGAALDNMAENRRREGDKLAGLVLDRLQQVESQVTATRELLPALMQQQRDRITARIADLRIDVDHNRLEQELVYMAQKADVDEELDRLEAHVSEVRHTLEKGGPCGRRLDFLMQELNREANTLSSKSISSSTTRNAVELKVLIEQMREQIQNIE